MAEVKPFTPSKLIVGIISARDQAVERTEKALTAAYGPVDLRSPALPFDQTDYYEKEMGKGLRRLFLSFSGLVPPESLPGIKAWSNSLEAEIGHALAGAGRVVNIDPGILTGSSLIMATAKNFAHRIPLNQGIYGHLELLFSKNAVKLLPWTYPDFQQEACQRFFLEVRQVYLRQLRERA